MPFCQVTLRGEKPLALDLGLLQREVAEQLGVHETTINNWERNRTRPHLLQRGPEDA